MNDTNGVFDNKLVVLFLLKETGTPLNLDQLTRLCSDFEGITYFDLCLYVGELEKKGFIRPSYNDNKCFYNITESGNTVLNELIELIPGIDLMKMKNLIANQIKATKSDIEINTSIVPVTMAEYKVSCYIRDNNSELINLSLYAGDIESAKKISAHWKQNATDIYSKIIDLMS